jgi:hypothetical protein
MVTARPAEALENPQNSTHPTPETIHYTRAVKAENVNVNNTSLETSENIYQNITASS